MFDLDQDPPFYAEERASSPRLPSAEDRDSLDALDVHERPTLVP